LLYGHCNGSWGWVEWTVCASTLMPL
jgi:hypothetical protein